MGRLVLHYAAGGAKGRGGTVKVGHGAGWWAVVLSEKREAFYVERG
jgi:hypothetical protein